MGLFLEEKKEKIMFTQVESFIFSHKLRLHISLSSKREITLLTYFLPCQF